MVDARFGTRFSYSNLGTFTARCQRLLARHGLQPGDTVISLLPNSADAIFAFLAALNSGIGFAPLPPDATQRDIARALTLLKPRLCFAADGLSPLLIALLRDAGVVTVAVAIEPGLGWLAADEGAPLTSAPHAARIFLSTSGSTGEPKAMVIDADRLWSSGRAFIARHSFVDENARFYNILPVSYLGGLFNLCLIPLAAGGSFVIAEAFSGRSMLGFWQGVEQHEVNVLWAVPSMVRALLSIAERTKRSGSPAPKLRGCFLGTATIDLATKEKFQQFVGVPVVENYALSETTFLTTESMDDHLERSSGSVGAVLPYVGLRFSPVSDRDEGAAGEPPTEIRVRSPFLFLGYLGENGTIQLPADEDGYFPTGDLGHLADGVVLVLDGRVREVIKKGGFFVSLREIEAIAQEHAAVEEAAAIPIPHEFYGEGYRLLITLKAGADAARTDAEFGAWLRDRVVRHKWPDSIAIVSQFPRTASGKIRKNVLAQEMAQ